ncbi:MAG: helix-turn-helix transcriptional regulator [Nitrosomonas sp.]|nr:helix-turn-helix transcriptional regulator [Nitrosomonas sp.]MDP1951169.1 helix-turn-helix transcriptional regulator [Nitrosomonas sp.]
MTLQKIKSIHGKDEYVLLPVAIYRALKDQIEKELAACETSQGVEQAYEPFILEDYLDNPVALARIKAGITQEQLAQRLGVSQAYVSQLERRTQVTNKMLERVHIAIR